MTIILERGISPRRLIRDIILAHGQGFYSEHEGNMEMNILVRGFRFMRYVPEVENFNELLKLAGLLKYRLTSKDVKDWERGLHPEVMVRNAMKYADKIRRKP